MEPTVRPTVHPYYNEHKVFGYTVRVNGKVYGDFGFDDSDQALAAGERRIKAVLAGKDIPERRARQAAVAG